MNLCSDCRGTGVKPEPMQGQIFDPRFGRFCPCPVGQTKWLNTLNCVSDQETKTRQPAIDLGPARRFVGGIKMD
jgi:hypothetical protein